MIVTPAATGRQLVRCALPLPRGMVQKGQSLKMFDGQREIDAAIRPLTWHPQENRDSRSVRRSLVTFVYDFVDTEPVEFEIRPTVESVASTDFPVIVEVDETQIRVQYADGPELTAELLAPQRVSAGAARVETVEENPFFRWQRFHLPDAQWPRIVEVRTDALGGAVIIAHLQRGLSENGYTPDLGWKVESATGGARLHIGAEEVDVGHQAARHDFANGVPCALFFAGGQYRLDHPAAPLKHKGLVDAQLEDGKLRYQYWRCRSDDQVPMQPTSGARTTR